jgi:hypothetical protein
MVVKFTHRCSQQHDNHLEFEFKNNINPIASCRKNDHTPSKIRNLFILWKVMRLIDEIFENCAYTPNNKYIIFAIL